MILQLVFTDIKLNAAADWGVKIELENTHKLKQRKKK